MDETKVMGLVMSHQPGELQEIHHSHGWIPDFDMAGDSFMHAAERDLKSLSLTRQSLLEQRQ